MMFEERETTSVETIELEIRRARVRVLRRDWVRVPRRDWVRVPRRNRKKFLLKV